MKSFSTRLPLIASLSTDTDWVPRCACRRRNRTSGQRALASVVELKPSVIESPKATTARAGRSAITSTPLSQYQVVLVEATGMVVAPVKSPVVETYEVWCARASWVVPGSALGTKRLIARSALAWTSSDTESLIATAPGGMVMELAPKKCNCRKEPGRTDAPVERSATLAAPMANGLLPIAFEKR